jgi:type IV secretory pathway VirB10-like protein
MIMRMLTTIAALSGLALAQPIHAQSTDPQLPQIAPPAPEALPDPTLPDQTPPDQAVPDQDFTDQNFTGIAIVALEDLPPELKTQAEAVITQTSVEDLLTLQSSIDASPQAATALAANGLDSSQVVAANIDGNGTLTLIVQTTT